eukprot:scaffold3596_cov316-Prasinococcus_capsulatus_cf.AAC.9
MSTRRSDVAPRLSLTCGGWLRPACGGADSQGEQWVAKCRTLEHCHTAECTQPFRDKFAGFASEDEAVDYVKSHPEQVTAVLVFDFEPDAIQVALCPFLATPARQCARWRASERAEGVTSQ